MAMEEIKKSEETNSSVPQEEKFSENKPTENTSSQSTQEKKKSNKALYVVIGVLVFLSIISVVGYFVVRNMINNALDKAEDSSTFIQDIAKTLHITKNEDGNITDEEEDTDNDTTDEGDTSDEDEDTSDDENDETLLYKASTKEKVYGKLEKKDMINDNFPSDLPICGGIVTASSYDSDYEVSVSLDTASTPDEVITWYTAKLQEAGWEITGQSKEEPIEGWIDGDISAELTSEEREIYITIDKNPYYEVTQVSVYEYL